jgi:hypothetical protein
MKFLMNIALGAVLLINAICMIDFYYNVLISVVVLMAFTFLYILLIGATSRGGL